MQLEDAVMWFMKVESTLDFKKKVASFGGRVGQVINVTFSGL